MTEKWDVVALRYGNPEAPNISILNHRGQVQVYLERAKTARELARALVEAADYLEGTESSRMWQVRV